MASTNVQDCTWRSRDTGLFISDQELGGQGAIFTRQNSNGARSRFLFALAACDLADACITFSVQSWL